MVSHAFPFLPFHPFPDLWSPGVIMTTLKQIAYEARRDNGGTWTLMGKAFTPETGYFVSVRLNPRDIESRNPEQDLIAACIAQSLGIEWNRRHNCEPCAYVGAWLRDDGAMVWDVTLHVASLDEALTIGRENGQMAVWDCYNGRAINCA
jgi:hypothetical protein